jgi:hypothetical protein
MDNINDVNTADITAAENELRQLIEEMLRPRQPPGFYRNSATYPRTSSNNDYLTLLQTIRDIMVMYHSNMSEYNNNVGLSLQLLQTIFDRHSTRPPTNINNTFVREPVYNEDQMPRTDMSYGRPPVNDHLFSYILYRPNIRYQDANTMRRFFQNIVVRPTPEQIDNSTEVITYQLNMENVETQCPITLDDFQEGEAIRQIRHCKHTFREEAIQNWFRCNVRCPICRYDIREYSVGTGTRPDTTTEPSTQEDPVPSNSFPFLVPQNPNYHELLQRISHGFATDINNILSENFLTGPSDTSQNFVFELQLETNV